MGRGASDYTKWIAPILDRGEGELSAVVEGVPVWVHRAVEGVSVQSTAWWLVLCLVWPMLCASPAGMVPRDLEVG